jgi:Tfp pilus assembly protein PilN
LIEINLIVGKKPFKMPTLLGIDLATLNLKMIGLAILISFVPGMFLEGGREEEINAANEDVAQVRQQVQKLEKKVDENKGIQDQVDALNRQEKKLAERLGVVKEIIKLKKNPMNIMLYVAKNIPEDVWIIELDLTGNAISIRGQALNYKSIGMFIENLKNSVFFNKDLIMKSSQTVEKPDTKSRVEQFEIVGTIARFE